MRRLPSRRALLLVFALLLGLGLRSWVRLRGELRRAHSLVADALVERGRAAQEEADWQRAEVDYAAARVHEERADARFGLALARSRAALPLFVRFGQPGSAQATGFLGGRAVQVAIEGAFARVSDLQSGAMLARLEHGKGLREVRLTSGLVLTRDEATARFWRDGKKLFELETRGPLAFDGSATGDHAAVADAGDGDGALDAGPSGVAAGGAAVLTLPSGNRFPLPGLPGVTSLALFDDTLLVRTVDGAVSQFSHAGPEQALTARLTGIGEPFALSEDGRSLVYVDASSGVWLTELGRTEPRVLLARHDQPLVALSRSGALVLSCDEGGTLRVFDLQERSTAQLLRTPPGKLTSCAIEGQAVVAGTAEGGVAEWTLPPPAPEERIHGASVLLGAAFGAGRLATAGVDGKVALWSLPGQQEGAAHWLKPGPPCGLQVLAFSRDGSRLAAAGKDDAQVWSVAADGTTLPVFQVSSPAGLVALSGDGGALLTFSSDALRLHRTGARDEAWHTPVDACSVALSPDGALVAVGLRDGTVELRRGSSGAQLSKLIGHQGPVRALAFDSASKRLASGGAEGTLFVWDAATGQGQQVAGARGTITGVAFSPASAAASLTAGATLLAASASDGAVRLWNSATLGLLGGLPRAAGAASFVAFSPDGSTLATSSDNTPGLRLLTLPGEAALEAPLAALEATLERYHLDRAEPVR